MTAETMENGLAAAAGRKPAVIVIDANPTTRLIAATLIDQFGGTVTGFASVGEAWTAIGGADVIVHRAGEALVGPLGEAAGPMPVVAIGGGGAVPSPYSPRELYQALSAALRNASKLAAAVSS